MVVAIIWGLALTLVLERGRRRGLGLLVLALGLLLLVLALLLEPMALVLRQQLGLGQRHGLVLAVGDLHSAGAGAVCPTGGWT